MSQPGSHPDPWDDLLRRVIGLTAQDLRGPELFGRIADLVARTTAADVCFVHVVDAAAGDLVLAGATAPFDHLPGTIRLKLGEGIAGWVAERGEPALVGDKWDDPRYLYIPALRGEDFSSMVSVPLLRERQRVIGVMNLHSRQAGHFNTDHVRHLQEVADLVAGIVQTAILYERLATKEEELSRVAARTVELQELDRRRLAGEIHDGISQPLVSAWYHLRAARASAPPGTVADELAAIETLVSDALDEARRATIGLRPAVLDDLGLAAGLRSLATGLSGIEVELDVDVDLEERSPLLAPHVETALYRVAQEALQNVQKHARSTLVRILLHRRAGGLELSVIDDGLGFSSPDEPKPASYGLEGMRERATLLGARLEVRSIPGHGTTVRLLVPTERLHVPAG
ncbi:MAG: GAF domain-containing sensor histidine kinase [Acidimicrobiales bacterium]